jgi:hypothetical protein
MEISDKKKKKAKNRTTLQSTISLLGIGYIKRKQNHYSKEPLAHPCLVQHYSQQPRYEIS